VDAEPGKSLYIASLLVPIIGIGLYPKVATTIYDATTNKLTALARNSVPSFSATGKGKNP